MDVQIEFVSDAALLIRFISEQKPHHLIHSVFRRLKASELPIINFHPAYETLLLDFDSLAIDPELFQRRVEAILKEELSLFEEDQVSQPERRQVEIPVTYGGESGPDLSFLENHLRFSESELVRLHSSREYEVAFLGFAPGFAYLHGLDSRLKSPRRETPRLKIPAGSVGIAGAQTGVYPEESPAGWQIIGRTPLKLFDPKAPHPTVLELGDRVRFVARDLLGRETRQEAVQESASEFDKEPSEKVMEVLSGGLFSTVQDLGRNHMAHLGVSKGGAADPVSLRLANRLVGNEESCACIEMVAVGGSFRFLKERWIALTGSDCRPRLDGHEISMWTSYPVKEGQTLSLNTLDGGLRSYLAVSGGIAVPELLGSRSTFVGGFWGGQGGRELRSGDSLNVYKPKTPRGYLRVGSKVRAWFEKKELSIFRVLRGPQWDWFSDEAKHNIFGGEFKVTSEANRQGLRLSGPSLLWAKEKISDELVTEGVAAGAIQVPLGGQALILYCEQQTTGGYPKIVTIVSADVFRLGQLRPGQIIRFEEASLREAWEFARERENEISRSVFPV